MPVDVARSPGAVPGLDGDELHRADEGAGHLNGLKTGQRREAAPSTVSSRSAGSGSASAAGTHCDGVT